MIDARHLAATTVVVVSLALVLSACGGQDEAREPRPAGGATATPSTDVATPGRAQGIEEGEAMNIQLALDGATVAGSLEDTTVGRDFAALLPLTLTLADFHRTERIADLPRRLDTSAAPPGTSARAGDIAYYAPWGNLALFYDDAPYADGLVRLGHLDDTATRLLADLPGSATITITLTGETT